MKQEIKRQIPDAFKDIEHWQTNRRTFLRGALVAGAMTQIGFFTSCSTTLKEGNKYLTPRQATIFDDVLNIFFPSDGNGPGAKEINAFGYIMWVLDDSLNRKIEDNLYVIEGINWVNETAEELYSTSFTALNESEKEALIHVFTETSSGKNWSSVVITLILEALLLDPIYGGNVDEAGWKWLNHTPGYPRPTEENRYERIMERQMNIKNTTA